MRVIKRDYTRTEHDDFVLHVQDQIHETEEVLELKDEKGNLLGWRIQTRYS